LSLKIRKYLTSISAALAITLITPAAVFAHVVVTPGQVGVGKELTFSVSVPNEREIAVTNLRLVIPDGVTGVTPTAKSSWVITTDKSAAKDPEVTVITWSDGTIPAGQRDDFSFSAQVPANATTLAWRAYQTYADGTIVHWDQKPAGSDDSTGNAGPYSVTKVVDDLNKPTVASTASNGLSNTALIISLVALVLGIAGFAANRKK
jgi:uncharacterized protein YcnI